MATGGQSAFRAHVLIDSHIHLDAAEFDADRAEVLARARASGVGGFVVPAVDRAGFARVLVLSRTEPDVFPALGIHPVYVDRAGGGDLEELDHLLAQGCAIAVGEIGLDGGAPHAARQQAFLIEQLKLARRYDLPVILHLRRAQDAVLAALRRIRVIGGIAHAFNGSLQQAQQFIALGFRLGFGGTMTFTGSRRICRLAAELPLEAMVLETDAPDMPPSWAQGRRNEPENLSRYAGLLAQRRFLPEDEIIRITSAGTLAALHVQERSA